MPDNQAPQPLGLKLSFGFGDRLGLSTPGHIRALREAGMENAVAPIFAQQSVRELTRTGRTPESTIADAARAVEAESWTAPWGADADHVKTVDQLQWYLDAGFTFFTIDVSDAVNTEGESLSGDDLSSAYRELLAGDAREGERLIAEYALASPHALPGGASLAIGPDDLKRAAVAYWRGIRHAVSLYEAASRMWKGGAPFDFEVSVDETSAPTTPAAHWLIASELKSAGVRFTSLAPRFVGRFEKAVDYIGNVAEFERDAETHVRIAQAFGDYKISVHSGSDKFALYPVIARLAGKAVHVKTAGTSWLEGLRIPARHDSALFRRIARLAIDGFEEFRASYDLSTNIARVPAPEVVSDADLESAYLNAPEADAARQVLHVAYGGIFADDKMKHALLDLIREHADEHAADLAGHLRKHVEGLKSKV